MRGAGLAVHFDPIGNIIGRLEGTDPNAPAVITGSHLDTVPEGGGYDGAVGVVAGLAAIKFLQSSGTLTHPLELIIFAAEESSRFGFMTIGSKAMTGMASRYAWSKAKDPAGVTLEKVLRDRGYNLREVDGASRVKDKIKAFVELHIEQGSFLENAEKKIGVVETIAAPTMLKITVEGVAKHAGSTPMDDRHDALVSAAMIVLAVQSIALEQSHCGTVATVGQLKVSPGAMNVIPGLVELWVDLRGVEQESIIETLQDIKDAVSTIADGQETPIAIDVMLSEKPVQMHEMVVQKIEDICISDKIPYQRMNSGAGHDAMNMARLTPTGMIFIPCRGGISHNFEEFTKLADIQTGIEVLTKTLYDLAK